MTSQERISLSSIVKGAVADVIESGIIEKELIGRGGSFRKTPGKNAHLLTKYVHRMITFHSGLNPSMPCTAEFHVMNFADKVLGQENKRIFDKSRFSMAIHDEPVKEIYKLLDDYADLMCEKFGFDNKSAARVWANVMGW